VLAAMTVMFVSPWWPSRRPSKPATRLLPPLGVDQSASALQAGGNMEGKETRFGINASSLFAVITTAASCGAVNAMHDSFTPLGGMVPMVMMQLGRSGVRRRRHGPLRHADLRHPGGVHRRPDDWPHAGIPGQEDRAHEMKLTSIAILVTPILVLAGTAVAVLAGAGKAGIANPGAHGFSEILYALTSAGNNNGSAFAGLSANTPFYNTLLGAVMWLGRFGVIVPVLAIAGALAAKKRLPVTAGTMPTHGPLFVTLLIGTVLLVGLLNYVPALALGPVVEHLMLWPAH
jgi:K+-transporting ATPase ATPase A chain